MTDIFPSRNKCILYNLALMVVPVKQKSNLQWGKNIDCRVICTPLKINEQQQGLILLMEIREE
jgi:hypothetical protein